MHCTKVVPIWDYITKYYNILLQLSTIDFSHKIFSGPSEHLPAMNRIKKIVASYNFSSKVFAVGHNYASWETDEIIQWETFQNVGISLVVVFIATALLLADFQVRNKRITFNFFVYNKGGTFIWFGLKSPNLTWILRGEAWIWPWTWAYI